MHIYNFDAIERIKQIKNIDSFYDVVTKTKGFLKLIKGIF